jgi:HEAT repeat protein
VAAGVLAVVCCWPGGARRAWAQLPLAPDPVGKLVDTLGGAESYKVRLQAAAVLARMSDPRVVGALGRAALGDPQPLVRAFSLKLLGGNPGGDATDDRARAVILRAANDRSPAVRAAAEQALAALSGRSAPRGTTRAPGKGARRTIVAVGTMGDRTGKASRALRDRMRVEVGRGLLAEPGVEVAGAATDPGVSYVVDGAIRRLELGGTAKESEAACAVELVVSRPPRGIVLTASGDATVQRPRRLTAAADLDRLQIEALQHAVRGAHETLAKFLASH